ncbi:hypothetical protein HG531_013573 [Fusarium graminearum]|nr:hypothetical protein HG531_013573 [Fusarium graminearum]
MAGFLGIGMSPEGLVGASKVSAVDVDTTQVIPVIQHRKYELNVVLLRGGDSSVETGNAVGALVDSDGLLSRVEELKVHRLISASVGVSEGPDARDFQPALGNLRHGLLDIGV